jgi:hypothetical protein
MRRWFGFLWSGGARLFALFILIILFSADYERAVAEWEKEGVYAVVVIARQKIASLTLYDWLLWTLMGLLVISVGWLMSQPRKRELKTYYDELERRHPSLRDRVGERRESKRKRRRRR